jgi:hypothetical protein
MDTLIKGQNSPAMKRFQQVDRKSSFGKSPRGSYGKKLSGSQGLSD